MGYWIIRKTYADGSSVRRYLYGDPDPTLVGTAIRAFQHAADVVNYEWTPMGRPRSTTDAGAGNAFSYVDDPSHVPIGIVHGVSQSNGSGRGAAADLPVTWVANQPPNKNKIYPNTVPIDTNDAGAGVGPDIILADLILASGYKLANGKTITWVGIFPTGKGNQDIHDFSVGAWATELSTKLIGAQSVERCYVEDGDTLINLWVQGEADTTTNPEASTDYDADALAMLATVYADLPAIAVTVVVQLPPNSPDNDPGGATYPKWLTVRADQAALANAGATPPRYVVSAADSDRQVADPVHYKTGTPGVDGQFRLAAAMLVACVAAGVLVAP